MQNEETKGISKNLSKKRWEKEKERNEKKERMKRKWGKNKKIMHK